jgi:hypothetical protein
MELVLNRIAKKNGYTIGKLSINGKYFCDTLEDADRGLTSSMPSFELKGKKIPHVTAIPTGRYQITMDVVSPRFGKSAFYKQYGGGRVPRLLNVPNFEGVLMHCGNTAKDTDGCILVGRNTQIGMVTDSKATYSKLYPILEKAAKGMDKIWITIK